ncbi:acyl-CoA thioester hydrolase/BAAT C-terminal domain-containing protein [Streptomyces sp. NPDC047085]|uniref:acyl-CoA thioester hydrolase/BAAT C-terminal domain-containing protein n=1 Tax=Streptomyces sp. NPDC047085 TaxID=3155140 RepID=UPI0033D5C236
MDAVHDRYPYRALVYPGAGHGVGTFPFLPEGTVDPNSSGNTESLGGNRAATAAAEERGWPKVLALLAGTQR